MAEIMEPRLEARRAGDSAGDLLDTWLDRTEDDSKKPQGSTTINMNHTLYALEDMLGGHSAVSNIALRALIDLGTNPGEQVVQGTTQHTTLQAALRMDLAAGLNGEQFSLKDKHRLPRATATFYETVGGSLLGRSAVEPSQPQVRLACSPLVPHVATRDTSVEGGPVLSLKCPGSPGPGSLGLGSSGPGS
jgi:cytochrome P450 family 307 subfamily A